MKALALLPLLFLSGPLLAAEKSHPTSATLTVLEDGRSALHDALHVLGKPTEQWKITDKDDVAAGPVDVVTFAQKNKKTIALYFYGGKFVQAVTYDAAQRPPKIRSDYKPVAAATAEGNLGAYVIKMRSGVADITAKGGAPAP